MAPSQFGHQLGRWFFNQRSFGAHVYSTAGTYTVTATVTDNLGATASTTSSVTVQAPQMLVSSPVSSALVDAKRASAEFSGACCRQRLFRTAHHSHADLCGWSAGLPALAPPQLIPNVAVMPGTRAFVIKGWDNSGRNFSRNFSVTVNAPPVAALCPECDVHCSLAEALLPVRAGSSDSDGTVVATTINFGDGTVASAASATHQYTVAGTYTVTATVTDNAGASSSRSQSIAVKPPLPPLPARP